VARSVDPNAYEHAARAMLYAEQDLNVEAAAELRRAIFFDNESPELHAALADIYLRLGRIKEAEAEVHASQKLGPTANMYLAKAHLEAHQGRFSQALDSLRLAKNEADFLERADLAIEVYQSLAEAEIGALDFLAARATLTELCREVPEAGTAYMRLFALDWAVGDVVAARTTLRRALGQEPNQIEALLAMAWVEASEGNENQATRVFQETLERSEGSLDVAVAFARFLGSVGKPGDAAQLAEDFSVGTLDADTLPLRIELERSARRLNQAIDLIAQGRALPIPEEGKNRLALTEAALRKEQNQIDEALAALYTVNPKSSLFLESRLRAAELLRDHGRVTEAKKQLEALTGLNPKESLEVTIALALCEEKSGRLSQAINQLETLLRRFPDDSRLTLILAAMEERRGRWQEALALAESLLRKKSTDAEVLNFWGFIASEHGYELPLAQKRITAAVALEPGSGGLLDSLGWVNFRLGTFELAKLFLEQAARLEPTDAEIQYHLGELYLSQAEKTRALAAFRRALTLGPEEKVRRAVEDRLSQLGN
jgi:tetratricopeptide (TPR) repeat protein